MLNEQNDIFILEIKIVAILLLFSEIRIVPLAFLMESDCEKRQKTASYTPGGHKIAQSLNAVYQL